MEGISVMPPASGLASGSDASMASASARALGRR
jgi:hypothetical protein